MLEEKHKDRLRRLIGHLENNTMPWGIVSTNTCFIGHVEYMFGEDETSSIHRFLGLDEAYSGNSSLIMPPNYDSHPEQYPRERAVKQLRYVLETGKVDWSATPYVPQG